MYDRGDSDGARIIEFEGGFTWIAHPEERGVRASHALKTENGVWLFDPLDAPNVETEIDALGDVVGVIVLSNFHARDSGRFANRCGVSVHIPEWMDRIESRVDAPVQRYTFTPDDAFRILPCRPFPGWQEIFCYHAASATLAVSDSIGTMPMFLIEGERLGLSVFRRLQPPDQLAGLEPERILVGHGEPITERAPDALQSCLDNPRGSFPAAFLENGLNSIRVSIGMLVE